MQQPARNAFKKFKNEGPKADPSTVFRMFAGAGQHWLKKVVVAVVKPNLDCRLFTSQFPRTLHLQPFNGRLPLTHVTRCCSPPSCALSSPQPLCSNCQFQSSIPSPKAPRRTWRTASKVVKAMAQEGATFNLNRNENRMASKQRRDMKILRTDEAGGLSKAPHSPAAM